MNKIKIPKGIRYLGNWDEFNLELFPPKSIVDKKIPGCGFTRYCLEGKENVILASPRKMLLENKKEQHPEIYLVRNELESTLKYDSESTIEIKDRTSAGNEEKPIFDRLLEDIKGYYEQCFYDNSPVKIAVTYDSYRLVVDILRGLGIFNKFITVVDEFQSILDDARFKADTELEFLDVLSTVDRVCYVSATPMLKDFIENIDEFKGIPFIELDWTTEEPGRLVKPNLTVKKMKTIPSRAKEVIESYLQGNFERVIVPAEEGEFKEVVSREAVLYVNSVKHIASIIKANKLQPEQVNILCSNTPENQKNLNRKLKSKAYVIGKPVARGCQHKMFTFCTRTVYLGADFYSTNARSFIFSDSNLDYLSMDISMDLPQILGRQRLSENPWNNSAVFFYKSTADYNRMTADDFKRVVNIKYDKSMEIIGAYNDSAGNMLRQDALIDTYEGSIKADRYSKNYVSVNSHSGSCKVPVLNNLVYLNEIRTFKIQQIDFKDRFSVMATIGEVSSTSTTVMKFFSDYEELTNYRDRLKFLCEYDGSDLELILQNFDQTDLVFQHYSLLGPTKCRALSYDSSIIKKEVEVKIFNKQVLEDNIISYFSAGSRISKKEVKEILMRIYDSLGYQKSPKASDLEEWFDIKSTKVKDVDGNWVHGFELIKRKQ